MGAQRHGCVGGGPGSCAGSADPNARRGPVTTAGKGLLLGWQGYFIINHNIIIPMIFPYCKMELGYAIAMLMEAPPAADDDGGNCCNCFFMAAVEVVAVNLPAPKRLPCRPQARGGRCSGGLMIVLVCVGGGGEYVCICIHHPSDFVGSNWFSMTNIISEQ